MKVCRYKYQVYISSNTSSDRIKVFATTHLVGITIMPFEQSISTKTFRFQSVSV